MIGKKNWKYPYLRESVKGMDSILQSVIDKYRKTAKLTLIWNRWTITNLPSFIPTIQQRIKYEFIPYLVEFRIITDWLMTQRVSKRNVSSDTTFVDVLEKLIRMEVMAKTAPINDNNKKKISYSICDNLSLFYYRYVFKYSSQMSRRIGEGEEKWKQKSG